MVLSGFLILNQRGKVLISRSYRADINPHSISSAFRTKILNTKLAERSPCNNVGNISFLHIKDSDLYYLVVTRQNSNGALIFELLHKLVDVFKAYFNNKVDEESIKENFAVIYELLDEMLDFGYPQNTEPDVLKAFITTKGLKTQMKSKELSEVLKSVTGTVSWRKPGIKHRKNEVFLDVIENVNMLMSSKGTILHADVTGKIAMKCFLSGMPECKFGLNDKLMLQTDSSTSSKKHKAIDIDDVTFHQCVKLGNFDNERSISFIPPDGEFELMKYRVQNAIVPPFRLISPTVRELGKTRLEVQVTVKSVFNQRLFGKNVQVIIPTPKNTAKCDIRVSVGKATYEPGKSAIIWKVKKFPGNAEYSLNAEVKLIAQTVEKKSESKPPIQLQFQVPMFTASGLHVRYLKIYEKSGYQAIKWVRYVTQGGTYENRY